MIIKINDQVFSPESSHIGICFTNDAELKSFIDGLAAMPKKEGLRWFLSYPGESMTLEDSKKFMALTEEQQAAIPDQTGIEFNHRANEL